MSTRVRASQALANTGQAIGDDSTRHQVLAPRPLAFADSLLTARELAARLRISTRAVSALCEQGKLAHVRIMNAVRSQAAEIRRITRPLAVGQNV